ncbi:methyl-accepting chemotaxis protein [Cohnella sp. WQ 127256]|uniref:methyl-accepting chemotaxis protein n=1 Tax=Cohnella sp. WQ 127256 TaxID=2938790 RepID=UPI002117D480|nr:methyl-accepting chemotaxis protein [Cohnella sp. WQ 127256]
MGKLSKSIRAKLVIWFLIVALVPLLISSLVSYKQNSQELIKKQKETAQSLVETKAVGMDDWLNRRLDEIKLAATTETAHSTDPKRISPYLVQIKKQSDVYEDVIFAGASGIIEGASSEGVIGININDREYFQKGMLGQSSYSDILTSKGSGNRVIVVSSPIQGDNGKVLGIIYGVVDFEKLLQAFVLEQTTGVDIMLVDNLNRIQLTSNKEILGKSIDESGIDAEYVSIINKGKTAVGTKTYTDKGKEYLVAYAPLKETNYEIYYTISMDLILESANAMQQKMIIVMIIASIIVVLFAFYISGAIAKPIKRVTEQVKRVADGDLTNSTFASNRRDEIGELGRHVQSMTTNLRELIHKVASASEQVAASSEELTASAEEASRATEQISNSAQEIASGAEQQVVNTNESQQIATDMSEGVAQISSLIQRVSSLSDHAVQASANGNQVVSLSIGQMNEIEEKTNKASQTVNELGNKSAEIENITSVITDIARQTNLLALNAAIEAARAGEQGRGFAVVAGEVRKLAEQSGHAAEQISEIIREVRDDIQASIVGMQDGITSVQEGTRLTEQAGHSFETISNSVSEVFTQIQEVSNAIQQLNVGSEDVLKSIESVKAISNDFSGSTQEVAAAAEQQTASMEEVAAASQTLAKMAEDLQASVRTFKF